MSKRTSTLQQKIESQEKKLGQLKVQLADAKKREAQMARKWEAHEKIVGMGIVHEVVGGDWTCVDMQAWNEYVHHYAGAIRKAVKRKPVDPDVANREVREFEREKREAKKENRKVIDKALEQE